MKLSFAAIVDVYFSELFAYLENVRGYPSSPMLSSSLTISSNGAATLSPFDSSRLLIGLRIGMKSGMGDCESWVSSVFKSTVLCDVFLLRGTDSGLKAA